jgi:hypothetical protein
MGTVVHIHCTLLTALVHRTSGAIKQKSVVPSDNMLWFDLAMAELYDNSCVRHLQFG